MLAGQFSVRKECVYFWTGEQGFHFLRKDGVLQCGTPEGHVCSEDLSPEAIGDAAQTIQEDLQGFGKCFASNYKKVLNRLFKVAVQVEDWKLPDVLNHRLQNVTQPRTLDLSGLGLDCFPVELCIQLRELEVIDLSNNELSGLPEEFKRFSKLKELKLDNNRFQNIPMSIGNLQITHLSIQGNNIYHIDQQWAARLPFLKQCFASGTHSMLKEGIDQFPRCWKDGVIVFRQQ